MPEQQKDMSSRIEGLDFGSHLHHPEPDALKEEIGERQFAHPQKSLAPEQPSSPESNFHGYITSPGHKLPYNLSEISILRQRITLPKREQLTVTDGGEKISVYDINPSHLQTMDQAALVILERISDAVKESHIFDLSQRTMIKKYLERAKDLAAKSHPGNPEKDEGYQCLSAWFNHVNNFQSFIYEGLKHPEHGINAGVGEMKSPAKRYVPDAAIIFFMRDPGVAKASLELRGAFSDQAFISGEVAKERKYQQNPKNPSGHILVRGGAHGAAEKIGYYLRMAGGDMIYDGRSVCGENLYPQMQLHYLCEYLYTRGPYETLGVLIDPKTRQFREFYPFPSVWHMPRNADFWIDNFEKIGLNNQARMLSRYSDIDRRDSYSLEEIEDHIKDRADHAKKRIIAEALWLIDNTLLEDNETQKEDFLEKFDRSSLAEQDNLIVEILKNIRKDNKSKRYRLLSEVVRNNLIRVRREIDWNGKEKGVKDENLFLAPLLDFQERESSGQLIIDRSSLDYSKFGMGGEGDSLSYFYQYEKYGTDSFTLIKKFFDPAERDILKLLQALNSAEMLKYLTGEKDPETGEFKGALALRREIIGSFADYYSEMILRGTLFEDRRRGDRTPLAAQINSLLRLGLFRGFYRTHDFEAAGIYNADYTNMIEASLAPHQLLALVLNRFSDKEVWEKSFLKGGGPEGRDIPYQALVAYSGYRRMREYDEMHRENVRVHYVEFDFGDQEEDPRKGLWQEIHPGDYQEFFPYLKEKMTDPLYSTLYTAQEKADIDKFIHCGLVDKYLEQTYDKDPENPKNPNPKNYISRRWWLTMDYFKREKEFNWILRRSKYAAGEGQGSYVHDQLEREITDYDARGRPHYSTHNINGEEVYTIKWVTDHTKPDYGNFEGIAYFKEGLDKVSSLLQGSGEFHPGCEKRLTPLYLYYDKTRQRNLVLALFASPTFALEAMRNTGDNWEDDHNYYLVANVPKLSQIFNLVKAQAGVDPDVITGWKKECGVDSPEVDDFEAERKALRIPNIEGKIDPSVNEEEMERNMETFKKVTFSAIPGGDLISGLINRIRSGPERFVVARGFFGGTFVSGGILALTGGLGITGGFASFGGAIMSTFGSLIGGVITASLVWDAGDEIGGLRRVVSGNLHLGLLSTRIKKHSPQVLMDGKAPLWDDGIPAEEIVKAFWVIPKEKLSRPEVGGR